jgi:hypothetical protein
VPRIASVCRSLDGMALAIELAAARLATLGLDGVESGLADALRMLSGGSRLDERHSSLRSTIDWSYALLDPAEQALLRRVSVFAAPFTVEAAGDVAGFPPADVGLADGLARLADNSLAIARPGSETRYRVLETIRQYGVDQLEQVGELEEVRARQVRWCLATAEELVGQADDDVEDFVQGGGGDGAWRGAFDLVADDLRAGFAWAVSRPELRADGHRLALLLASLTFLRGLPAEAQRRFEEAATLTDDPAEQVMALNDAAGAALCRHVGNDAFRLWRRATDIAADAGDGVTAAHNLAIAATLINRGPGVMAEVPPPEVVDDLIQEAVALAGNSPLAEPSILTAQAFNGDELDPVTQELTERAVALARRVGDAYDESAALDELSAVHLAGGDVPAAVATVRTRIEVLRRIPLGPGTGMEFSDCYAMASEISLTAGDFAAARTYADRLASLPFVTELDHIATARRIKVDAMAGDLDAVVAAAERFRRGWEQAGRPVASNLAGAALAVAMVHGLRGDEEQRAEWRDRTIAIGMTAERLESPLSGYGPTFDAIVELHVGDIDAADARLAVDPDRLRTWFSGEWRPWYAALWAEAAVLAGRADAAERIERARLSVAANPVATAPRPSPTATPTGWRRPRRRWSPRAAATSGPAPWCWRAASTGRPEKRHWSAWAPPRWVCPGSEPLSCVARRPRRRPGWAGAVRRHSARPVRLASSQPAGHPGRAVAGRRQRADRAGVLLRLPQQRDRLARVRVRRADVVAGAQRRGVRARRAELLGVGPRRRRRRQGDRGDSGRIDAPGPVHRDPPRRPAHRRRGGAARRGTSGAGR